MLNKEDILALTWEYSEGRGERYTFTEESLFAFLKELTREKVPAQDEYCPECSLNEKDCYDSGCYYLINNTPAQTDRHPEQSGLDEALRPIHAMILNALDRDAEEGRAARGEMAAELRATLAAKEVNKI